MKYSILRLFNFIILKISLYQSLKILFSYKMDQKIETKIFFGMQKI
ncbi:hypothetical protein ATHSA_1739 [Athalassotoga saccharophila]|nr:hypothetical protein ATHSA_1739 [Athalassotoga saccharophila]